MTLPETKSPSGKQDGLFRGENSSAPMRGRALELFVLAVSLEDGKYESQVEK
jgi:hypothetical protein